MAFQPQSMVVAFQPQCGFPTTLPRSSHSVAGLRLSSEPHGFRATPDAQRRRTSAQRSQSLLCSALRDPAIQRRAQRCDAQTKRALLRALLMQVSFDLAQSIAKGCNARAQERSQFFARRALSISVRLLRSASRRSKRRYLRAMRSASNMSRVFFCASAISFSKYVMLRAFCFEVFA